MIVAALLLASLASLGIIVLFVLVEAQLRAEHQRIDELALQMAQLVAPPPGVEVEGDLQEHIRHVMNQPNPLPAMMAGIAPKPFQWGPPIDTSIPPSVTMRPVLDDGDRDTFDVEPELPTAAPRRGEVPERDRKEDELR